jgi:protein gp37
VKALSAEHEAPEACHLIAKLRETYPAPQWAVFSEVPRYVGADVGDLGILRRADALAVRTWGPADRWQIRGFEVKRSRGDWLRELAEPEKAEIGGESGPGARECNVAWIRCVVDQADAQGVPVFFKQWGAHPTGLGAPIRLRSRKGADPSEWPSDLAARRAFPRIGGAS